MIRHFHNVRNIARVISTAADGALEAYRDGRVEEEPQLTDRIIGAIENRVGPESSFTKSEPLETISADQPARYTSTAFEGVADKPPGRIVWNARTLRTGRGRAAEEKRHGADLMGILNINIPNYHVTKGFLAQAKLAEPEQVFSKRDWKRLHKQCETMLTRTPDSFVWVYSKERGIRVFSAISVVELDSRCIFDLYDRNIASFFEYHLECFIGDHRLNSTNIHTLDALGELPVERVLELSGRYAE